MFIALSRKTLEIKKKIPIGFADKIYLKIYHTGFK